MEKKMLIKKMLMGFRPPLRKWKLELYYGLTSLYKAPSFSVLALDFSFSFQSYEEKRIVL